VTAKSRPFRASDHLPWRVATAGHGRVAVRYHPRTLVVLSALVGAVIAAALWSMTTGTIPLTVAEIWGALWGRGEDRAIKVVRDIRLPRLVTGVFVGAASGISGAVFQSISRNVLGSPDVVGFTAGAATGAIVQITFFNAGPEATAIAAATGGVAAALLVALLSRKHGSIGGYRLVLVGIGVGATLASFNGLLLTRTEPEAAITAHQWLVGTLNARTWEQAIPVVVVVAVLGPLIAVRAGTLSLMEIGDDFARQVGAPVERTRGLALVAGVGLIAVATSATGPIAFVALASPQLVRRLTGSPNAPIVTSAFMGAALLVAADAAAQHLPWELRVPVGLMTGLFGGVYLLYLLTRARQL